MSVAAFDPQGLLDRLPRRPIARLLPSVPVPRVRSVGTLSDYNGFTGKERLRTFEVAKWLTRMGAMPYSGRCDLCGGNADQQHAEDYYDLTTWIDICRGCHVRLHQRFRHSAAWTKWLDNIGYPPDCWARHIAPSPFNLAAYIRERGSVEPSFAHFSFVPATRLGMPVTVIDEADAAADLDTIVERAHAGEEMAIARGPLVLCRLQAVHANLDSDPD